MRHLFIGCIFIAVFALALFALWRDIVYAPIKDQNITETFPKTMKFESDAFQNGNMLPAKYTCDGSKINPPLSISEKPTGTKSLALIMEDPDAPRGTFDHWLMWNIPASTTQIYSGETPAGIYGMNTAGSEQYIPPCPPSGAHRYFFQLYALDEMLSLPAGSSKTELLAAMKGHILDRAELVGMYERPH